MRAGLLSDPLIIERLNRKFVSTWIIVDDLMKLSGKGGKLSQTLAENWQYPLDIMFLTPDGRLVSKLNSFKHFRTAHPDVSHPPTRLSSGPSHVEVFLDHLAVHFGKR